MNFFDQVFEFISTHAGSGAQSAGDLADWAIEVGLTFDQFNQILQQVSAHAGASPAIIDYTQQAMRVGQDYYANPPQQNGWILPVLLVGGLIAIASSK